MTQESSREREPVEAIKASLLRRASELWGDARASQMGSAIDDTARSIHRLAHALPDAEEEPGFYF